jgi:hypothetical protein
MKKYWRVLLSSPILATAQPRRAGMQIRIRSSAAPCLCACPHYFQPPESKYQPEHRDQWSFPRRYFLLTIRKRLTRRGQSSHRYPFVAKHGSKILCCVLISVPHLLSITVSRTVWEPIWRPRDCESNCPSHRRLAASAGRIRSTRRGGRRQYSHRRGELARASARLLKLLQIDATAPRGIALNNTLLK